MKKIITLLLTAYTSITLAAGPETVAFSNRSLWPETINSNLSFDRASRAEILIFANSLNTLANQDADTLKSKLRIKQVNRASVVNIKHLLFERLLKNWQSAAVTCTDTDIFCAKIDSEAKMIEAALNLAAKIPKEYQAWYINTAKFHENYAGELLRLAALFPAISSEIDTFSSIEHNGVELPDRQFLLTFDDGPTAQNGYTDRLLDILNKANLRTTFYMLGENLQTRLKQSSAIELQKTFNNQCIALHGWQHQSHAKWSLWQNSVLDTQKLVKTTFPEQYRPWFRPPYGQRLADSAEFFKKNGLQVALWNIDSQDWNSHVSGDDAAQRVFTLMLLWRHGVILFHDIHPKALLAVPKLIEYSQQTGVTWKDCQTY